MKNKHSEFYHQFIETLNLSGGVMDRSGDYASESASSFSDQNSSLPKSSVKTPKKKSNEVLGSGKTQNLESHSSQFKK